MDPRALPSCVPSGSRMSPVVRGGLFGPHPLESVPVVSAGGSPGGAQHPQIPEGRHHLPKPFPWLLQAPCGALPPPHPTLLCALGRGEASPERRAWQLLWQPHIFLGIPNDLLAFAVIYSFFGGGLSEVGFRPLGPEERAHPVRCRSQGRAGGAAPVLPHLGTASWGAAGTGAPCPPFVRGRGPNPSFLYPWGG